MKELLAVIPLLLCSVVAEAPAPYPPSGFRPAGPAFELPQKNTQQKQQEYLPPVEPQRAQPPSTSYGIPEEDVSVQGLPTLEQQPIFQASPINGQEYVGPNFSTDIRNLDDSYRQAQYQTQQERYREFERQRQLEAAQARNRVVTPQVPRQFVTESTFSTTEPTSTRNPDDLRTTESSTELNLNEGETLDNKSDDKKDKVTVEVSKQKIREYPGELFLSSLAQLQLQPQFVPFQQLGQIRAPIYFQPIQQEPSQKQVAGYDAQTHFAAFPSVLAQQQYLQRIQNQGFTQTPALLVARSQEPTNVGFTPQNAQPFINNQYQPIVAQVPQNFPQEQPQNVNQDQYTQPKQEAEEDDEQNTQQQPQFVYQQSYQPQEVIYQPAQPQSQSREQQSVFLPQAQLVNYQNPLVQQYQNPYPQQINQPQNGYTQPQLVNPQQYQNGYIQQQFLDQNQFQNGQQQVQIPQQIYQNPQQFQNGQQQVQIPQQAYQNPQQFQNGQTQVQIPQQVYQDPQFQNTQQQVQIPQQVYQDQQFLNPQQQIQYPQQVFLDQQQFMNGQQQVQIPQFQGQDALQSGLDVNQQGNGVDQTDKDESDDGNTEDDGSTSIAVATAFGARTQPRMFTRYGVPVPVPPQADADTDKQSPEDNGAVAEANAFSTGRRKSSKLRSRRLRPIFTLDRSGHLVLAQDQN